MEINKKTCGMCAEEIGVNAKRCPHCRTWQSKIALLIYHPATSITLAIIPIIFGYFVMAYIVTDMLGKGELFEPHKNKIVIKNTELEHGENNCGARVVILGEIENNSNFTWEHLKFEVVFYDSGGNKIDSGQDSDYSFMIPKGKTTPLKLSFKRDFPEELYSTFIVKILTASEMKIE